MISVVVEIMNDPTERFDQITLYVIGLALFLCIICLIVFEFFFFLNQSVVGIIINGLSVLVRIVASCILNLVVFSCLT